MKNIAFFVAALAACAADASPAFGMNAHDAKAYFSKASAMAEGYFGGKPSVAALIPSEGSAASRLEVWSRSGEAYELVASAPKAGCLDCSGPSGRPNPDKFFFANDSLEIEYRAEGSGLGSWSWRSTWGWDPTLLSARAIATQKLGSSDSGQPRHSLVSFISGSRMERKIIAGASSASDCRADIAKTPIFAELDLRAFFDGRLDPPCESGGELDEAVGDGLAHLRQATPHHK